MKLPIDENISHRILKLIDTYFPNSIHISSVSKNRCSDIDIWLFAKKNHFIVLTHDADFYEWQLLRGYPPKIIWLRFGNSKTEIIAEKIIKNIDQITNFIINDDIGLLEIH